MFDEVVASNQQGERKDWSTNLFFLLEPGHHPIRRLERLNLTFNLNIRHYLFINIYLKHSLISTTLPFFTFGNGINAFNH